MDVLDSQVKTNDPVFAENAAFHRTLAEQLRERPGEIIVAVSSDGRYTLNRRPVDGRSVEQLTAELRAASAGRADTVLIVSADALSTHQSVINVLDAARRAGLARLSFAAQTGEAKAAP